MQKILDNFDKYLKIYFLVSIFLLSFGLITLYKKVEKISVSLTGVAPEVSVQQVDICGPDCKKEIEKTLASAIATFSAETKGRVTPTPARTRESSKAQTIYIPLAGSVTTTSTSWVDVPGTDTYINLIDDYGKDAEVSWDAFLSVANSNGQAYARLYDATHAIAVNGSEITTVNNASLEQASSGNLNLWSGKNLYRVQIKSLNSFVVTFGSGRIKITY